MEFESIDRVKLELGTQKGGVAVGGQVAFSTAELLPAVYTELKRLARHRLSAERPDHTLQATALVHEAYLRLASSQQLRWTSKGHFFRTAADVMRRILIDHARARAGLKRGGGCHRVPLDLLDFAVEADGEEILALEAAVSRFESHDPNAAAVVRLRFYAGLSVAETAEALGISARTVKREWAFARAWLFRELTGEQPPNS